MIHKTIIKSPILAGMPLNGQGSNRLKLVGYNYVALIYDSKEKDRLIREKRIKQVML